jgi:hypothetical protein
MAASGRTLSKISQLANDYLRFVVDGKSRAGIQLLINKPNSDECDAEIMTAFQEVINQLKDNSPNKEQLLRFIRGAELLRKEAAQLHNQDNPFLALPPELLLAIIKEVPTNQVPPTLGALSRISTSRHGLFQSELNTAKLAHYIIVEPNPTEVKKLINAYPELLMANIKEVEVRGRKIRNNTPFQLAYGAGDDDMCLVLKKGMVHHLGSEEAATNEIRKQVSEKFKEDEASDTLIKNHLATLLAPVIQAITAERFDNDRNADGKLILSDATLTAINTFREDFDKTQPKIIDQGMHFRSNTLQEIYDAYAQAAGQGGYDYYQCALFEDGVLSSVLSYVPENDAQRFSQGLYYLQKDQPEVFARRQTLRGDPNNNFYRILRSSSRDFFLSGSCIDMVVGAAPFARRAVEGWRPRWAVDGNVRCVSKLMSNKNFKLTELCGRSGLRPRSTQP